MVTGCLLNGPGTAADFDIDWISSTVQVLLATSPYQPAVARTVGQTVENVHSESNILGNFHVPQPDKPSSQLLSGMQEKEPSKPEKLSEKRKEQ